ncbi:MAG TPA: histidine kinase dimerization/phosphoacceptor domain -containing protein [Azospirillaceae bacterium]|nr:histidine kinase dimerization/phosphoacceptor domain -containing protein [Azospirillaceae bacterium]
MSVEPLDLTICDREPIHIPGAIQPHGTLLCLDPESFILVRSAGPTLALFGHDPAALPGRTAAELVGAEAEARLRSLLPRIGTDPVHLGAFAIGPGRSGQEILCHRSGRHLVLELEPSPAERPTAAGMMDLLQSIVVTFGRAGGVRDLCRAAAAAVRAATGFDRVMIYRFHADGVGVVFAEDVGDAYGSLLNHHYPASDIPQQARSLYLRNRIRLIPDAGYVPSSLVPADTPDDPLDMSDCVLRSVSPIHLRYLANMGVTASMSVSVVVDGRLWGLISCHHATPRHLSHELRSLCVHVGQVLSQRIEALEEAEAHAEYLRLQGVRSEIVQALADAEDLDGALAAALETLGRAIPSDGVALVVGDAVAVSGHAPGEEAVARLAGQVPADTGIFASHRLGEDVPGVDASQAAGILAIGLGQPERAALLWFRAELVETVEWAGNPHKQAEVGSDGILSPRKSFDLWRETVRGQARPWTPQELEAARLLRDGLVDLRQRQAIRRLNRGLEASLAQRDILMREINHRVQNSLQLVRSMLHMQAREAGDERIKAQFEEARRRLGAVALVHRRLYRADQIEAVELDRYLVELRQGLIESFGASWDPHLRVEVDPVLVRTDDAVILALLVTEFVTNAVKYAYGGAEGPIEVIVRAMGDGLELAVCDRGGGLDGERSAGFGSRATRTFVDQLSGTLELLDNSPGTRAVVRVPRVTAVPRP